MKTLYDLVPGDEVIFYPAGLYHEQAEVMKLARKTPGGLLVVRVLNRDEYFYPENGESRKAPYPRYFSRSLIMPATDEGKAAIQLASDRRYLSNLSCWSILPAEVITQVAAIVRAVATVTNIKV